MLVADVDEASIKTTGASPAVAMWQCHRFIGGDGRPRSATDPYMGRPGPDFGQQMRVTSRALKLDASHRWTSLRRCILGHIFRTSEHKLQPSAPLRPSHKSSRRKPSIAQARGFLA